MRGRFGSIQILIFQCAREWCTRKPSDSVWVKGVVVFLLVADTLSSIFDVWFTYDYCVVRVHINCDRERSLTPTPSQKKFGDKAAIMYSSWGTLF